MGLTAFALIVELPDYQTPEDRLILFEKLGNVYLRKWREIERDKAEIIKQIRKYFKPRLAGQKMLSSTSASNRTPTRYIRASWRCF